MNQKKLKKAIVAMWGKSKRYALGAGKRIAVLLEGKGESIRYYAALTLALAVLGTAAYGYRNRDAFDKDVSPSSGQDPAAQIVQSIYEPEEEAPEERTQLIVPVAGETVGAFSPNELVWSEDLAQWQTHPATDFAASAGEAVVAAADGTVVEAYYDPLYGNTIVIDHGQDCIIRYASLNTLQLVETGTQVAQGEVISSAGSCPAEAALGVHVHVECYIAGSSVDFSEILINEET